MRWKTVKWNKKSDVLALMVGHGTQLNGVWDSGCAYKTYTEAELMLPIVKVAAKLLRKSGVRVITDADKNNNRNMKARVAWANKVGAKLYMSVHCDYKYATKGVAPLYKTESGKAMAVTVGKKVAKQMDMKWKGVFRRTDLYELNATNMPAVIFETGAIKADLKYLKNYKKYGRALAKSICAYLEVKYVPLTNAERFNKKYAQILRYANEYHFKYKHNYDDCPHTWEDAKKKKVMNCSLSVCFALQEIGLLPVGQSFFCNTKGGISFRGGLTADRLKKIATIDHPDKKPNKLTLKKGDIVGYKNPAHTMSFCKRTTKSKPNVPKGTPMWCSWSNGDIGKKVPHVKRTYNSKVIVTRIRLK